MKNSNFVFSGEGCIIDDFIFQKQKKAAHIDVPRKGGPYDFPVDYPDWKETLEEFKKHGFFDGYRITCDPNPGKVAACEPDKYFFIMDMLRATLDFTRPGVKEKYNGDFQKFLEDYYRNILDIIMKYPDNAWGCAVGEMDSCCKWPENNFRNKKEAYRFWEKTFFESRIGSNNPCDLFRYLENNGLDYRNINIMVQTGLLFSIHYYYHWGFRFVWLERGCGLSNVQLGAAFLRGASRQFSGKKGDKYWGFDFSLHHPHHNQLTWYDSQGRRMGGWTESLMLRSWMTAYLSGADLVHAEGANYSSFIFDEKGIADISPAGKTALEFHDFVKNKLPDRGETYAPVALMLNFYHGFDARHSIKHREPLLWGNKVPLNDGDYNISNTLELFFPGHDESWGAFDEAFNPDVPWKDMWDYLDFLKKGHDMRPYEKGHLVESPFGDCVDVLLDNATEKNLSRYKIIILAGKHDLDCTKSKRLLKWVEKGGVLISSYDQIPEFLRKELAVDKTSSGWDYDSTVSLEDNKKFGGCRYGFYSLKIKNGKALAENHNGVPLAWEIPFGKGKLVLSAVPYSQDVPAKRILPVLKHVFGKYIDGVLELKAEPEGLELILSSGKNFKAASVFNHYEKEWKGKIKVNVGSIKSDKITVRDIWNNTPVDFRKNGEWINLHDTVEPFSFKIYKITCNQ